MTLALEGARRHYSQWFHPFPWDELRLSESPSYAGYAQGFPTNITFSEAIGFLTLDEDGPCVVLQRGRKRAIHRFWPGQFMKREPNRRVLARAS